MKLIQEHYNSMLKVATDRQIELRDHLEKELTKMTDGLTELRRLKEQSASVSINIPEFRDNIPRTFKAKYGL